MSTYKDLRKASYSKRRRSARKYRSSKASFAIERREISKSIARRKRFVDEQLSKSQTAADAKAKAIDAETAADLKTSKSRIRLPKEVMDRFKFDLADYSDRVSVIYLDRFQGLMSTPLTTFDHSTIAKHRIRQFKYGDTIIWDRKNRVDKIFGPGSFFQTE